MPVPPLTQVKICGLKTAQDITCAITAGADFIGLVHFAKSPRHLELEQASILANQIRNTTKSVMLLVNPDDTLIKEVCTTVKPDYLQLHGKESPKRTAEIKARFGLPIIKAIAVATHKDFSPLKDYEDSCDIVLLDAKPAPNTTELPGGNGISFDWQLLKNQTLRHPYMLAGGLTPDNVTKAIQLTGAPIVDVSSGVESSPGTKDHAKVKAFIAKTKQAEL